MSDPNPANDVDILSAIARIRHEFRRAGLSIPDAIILKTPEDGMRLLGTISQRWMMSFDVRETAGTLIEHPDGSVYREIEIKGMKVRWPSSRLHMPNGGYVWT